MIVEKLATAAAAIACKQRQPNSLQPFATDFCYVEQGNSVHKKLNMHIQDWLFLLKGTKQKQFSLLPTLPSTSNSIIGGLESLKPAGEQGYHGRAEEK